ncbi:MAG: elongation factor P [Lentisphaeria bacterium]|jgi:elongation factor P
MATISVSDLRKGAKVELDNQPYVVTDFDFCKPGKGQALYRCKLKNMISGSTMDRTWRSADKVDTPDLANREVTYSYADGEDFIFSDNETYEEIRVPNSVLGNRKYFLIENANCEILLYNDKPIEVTLPIFIEKRIVHTEPGVRGDTATNTLKPAKLDNGYVIQVPLFVNEGDWVKVDTRTGTYSERILNKK